jgi:hypothetical protein|tara:strand:+ start:203 stop:910 length:708 start_codon:yes stop_codon:yes gene_type:complete
LDKLAFFKVITDYFSPVYFMSDEEKRRREEIRMRKQSARAEEARKRAAEEEAEQYHEREAKKTQRAWAARAAERDAMDEITAAFDDAERVVLKTLRRVAQDARAEAKALGVSLIDRPARLKEGSPSFERVFGAVKEARSRTKAALENVKSRALGEIFAAQEAGFVTETWRKQSDSRYRAFCGLLQSLLQSFEKATAAVVANPEAPAEPEVRTNVFHPSLGFNTLLSIPSRLSTDR